jgi:hypothetical protein
MSGRKYVPPDHVEQAGRELARGGREGPAREIADADRARALTMPFKLFDGAEDKAAATVAEWALDDADKVRLLQMLGLAPEPEAAPAVPVRRLAERPQLTGAPTLRQQEMAERMARFAAHLEAGLNPLQAAREMEISRKTALRYAEAIGGTGGAS